MAGFTRPPSGVEDQLPRSWPPSTEIVWPVTQLASGERRNSATRATSSGWPRRPNGIERKIALYSWGLLALCRSQLPPGNSIDPGQMQLTRTPFLASAAARFWVYCTTAALATPYGVVRTEGWKAEIDEMLRTAPAPDCSRKGVAAKVARTVAIRSTAMLPPQPASSSVVAKAEALLTRMSMPPKASAAPAIDAAI